MDAEEAVDADEAMNADEAVDVEEAVSATQGVVETAEAKDKRVDDRVSTEVQPTASIIPL